MSEGLGNHPLRTQILSELQLENDILGITDIFRAELTKKADGKKKELEAAVLDNELTRLQRESDQVQSAIDDIAPITPVIYQYGSSLQLCLRREYDSLGLVVPGSTVKIASSEVGVGEYTPEGGFTAEQVDAVLGQLARYMSFSELN
ncbi:MAG TPA: hypothetical protein VEH48_00370 [Candidatus Nitrosopolaris sp.]|nr:hypothetical protein [Candidatus Nitrosopolaris sp.]